MKKIISFLWLATSVFSASIESRIIGGEDLNTIENRDFVVAIGFAPLANIRRFDQHCGGTLIDSMHVLTAAHCVTEEDMYVFAKNHILPSAQIKDVLGDVFGSASAGQVPESDDVAKALQDVSPQGELVKVARVFIHKDYHAEKSGGQDIAILKLESPVEIAAYPALPSNQTDAWLRTQQIMETMGWGITSGQGAGSDVLRTVQIKVLTQEQCSNEIALFPELQLESQSKEEQYTICAGGSAVGNFSKGACSGDSGGPLLYNGVNGYILAGIVSRGDGICTEREAGLYTKVEAFLNFIAESRAGSYDSPGRLRKGDIDDLPIGFSLVGTAISIDETADIFESAREIHIFNKTTFVWKTFFLTNGQLPSTFYIPAKSGFWVVK